ncbi:MAG: dihydroneopterin aldolase [Rhodobiaceae bacterium]|jgi:dihydroneopterin aldolase|nr:dihydroneopterin aldolase [Rhodobiaceae bacterium]
MNQHPTSSQKQLASAALGLRHVFVKRLTVSASIGIHPHERAAKQTVLISLDAAVAETSADVDANIEDVVCYESMTKTVLAILEQGHVDLVETLAETIADTLLADIRIRHLRVQVEKPDAIEAAESVGIAIERLQTA